MNAESIKCFSCDSEVELPANFCDMCGARLNVSSGTAELEREIPVELIIRIAIPVIVTGVGLYLFISTHPLSKRVLLYLLPLMIGAVAGSANNEVINSLQTKIINWSLFKLSNLKDKGGIRHRFFFKPWHWMLSSLVSIQEKISNPFVRSGFLLAAFLYLTAIMLFIIYIATVVVITIIVVGIIFLIIGMIMGWHRPDPSGGPFLPKDKLHGKDIYDTKGIFSRKVGHVDKDGNVYDTTGMFRRKVAEVDDSGNISDTTGFLKRKVGEIDESGNIADTTGIFKDTVGKIDEDGRILDTTGIFNKEKGKIK